MPGTQDLERLLSRRPALGRDRDLFLARQEPARHAARRALDVAQAALRHDLPTPHAGAGAKVHHMIGRPDRLFIVFHDDDGVPQIAQVEQALQQPGVVAGMQSDGRFIQNVDDPHQPAADLPRQPNPLALTTGQCRGRAVQCEIVQPAPQQESQPAANFFQHFCGDVLAGRVEVQSLKEIGSLSDAQAADFCKTQAAFARHCGDQRCGGCGPFALGISFGRRDGCIGGGDRGPFGIAGRDADTAGLTVQPGSLACTAMDHLHVLFQLPPPHRIFGLAVGVHEIGKVPGISVAMLPRAARMLPRERDMPVSHAIQKLLPHLGGQFIPRRRQQRVGFQIMIGFEGLGHSQIDMLPPASQTADRPQQDDGPLLQREAFIGDQQRLIKIMPYAQPLAIDTHPLRTVETEELRAGWLIADPAMRAGIVRAVEGLDVFSSRRGLISGLAFGFSLGGSGRFRRSGGPFLADDDAAPRQSHGVFNRFRQPSPAARSGRQAVHDDFNVMPHLPVKLQVLGQMNDIAVDACP